MEVAVESLSGLKRRVCVSIPSEQVELQVQERLKHLAAKVKLDGFRPGKVPRHIVEKQYLGRVRVEVAQELLEETLPQALQQKSLSPVSTPAVDKFDLEPNQNFTYAVSFEVLPEITIIEPDKKIKMEWFSAEVKEADIDQMIEKLQAQHQEWSPVERKAKKGDKVSIDFDGTIEGEPIESGKATEFSLELGSGQMIPGFEEALIGHQAGETFTIEVTFPEDYHEKEIAGKKAQFDIKLHQVLAGKCPELDTDFVKKFGIESGEVADLRADIAANMDRELKRRLREMNHDACFNVLAELNEFEMPIGLIDKEIEHLKHEMYHRIFGPKHTKNEKIPDFPRELFEERAKKRVHLGLLFAEYVKKHSLVAAAERVEAMLEQYAAAYTDPEAFKRQCQADKQQMAEIEALVVEQLIAENIRQLVSVKEKTISYQDAMNDKVAQKKDKEAE